MLNKNTRLLFKMVFLDHKIFRSICFFLCICFSLNPLKACKLWAVCNKSDGTFETLSSAEQIEVEAQLTSFFQQSQAMADGWSLFGYGEGDLDSLNPIQRSEIPAAQDSSLYWSAVEVLLNNSNRIGLGHLRLASSGTSSIPNPHPWIFYKDGLTYSLMHNGTVNKNILYDLITNNGSDLFWLESHPPQTFGAGEWKEGGWTSVVDSELILLLLMKLIELNGDILLGLKSTMSQLICAGVPPGQLNIIFSNGETLYVFGGTDRLYYAESDGHYAIMTSPSVSINLNWNGIEDQELYTFSSSGFERYPNFVSDLLDEEISFNPKSFSMGRAYPNPFNSSVRFSLKSSASGSAQISIISVNGKLIDQFNISVFKNDNKIIQWQPRANIASGTYFVRAESKGIENSQKILFIK